jgi:hypothetical protein
MANRSRYRYISFVGGRILQSREMAKLQNIATGLDDTNARTSYDLDALFREGATLNITPTITVGTKTVTLTATDGTKPMLIFVRGRWEALTPAEAPAVTLTVAQTQLFLNWQLRKVTSAEDTQLVDTVTSEATAEMGELDLQVTPTDDSARVAAVTEFEKNLSPIVVYTFVHGGSTMTLTPASNVNTQALADANTAGLVKLTTLTSGGQAVSNDDPRMSDGRTPLDGTITDVKVQPPVAAGGNNADGTPIYNVPNSGGILAKSVIYAAGTQLLSDFLTWIKTGYNSLLSSFNTHVTSKLGTGSHPMPTAQDVGATPASHQGLPLGAPGSHPPVVAQSQGGFQVNRDASVTPTAGDAAYGVFEGATKKVALQHDGDVFSLPANAKSANPIAPATTTGPLGLMSIIAAVLSEHVNQTSHKNPHGLILSDLGGVAQSYVDTQDAGVLASAKTYTDSHIAGVTISFVAVTNGFYLIVRFAPNNSNAIELAFGSGFANHGDSIPFPPSFSIAAGATVSLSPRVIFDPNHPAHGLNCFLSGGNTVIMSMQDGSGNTWFGSVNWTSLAWRQGA